MASAWRIVALALVSSAALGCTAAASSDDETVHLRRVRFDSDFRLDWITASVGAPVVAGDGSGPWIDVAVDVRNQGPDTHTPGLVMTCAGQVELRALSESTFLEGERLASGAVARGRVHLGPRRRSLPADGARPCRAPAAIQLWLDGWDTSGESAVELTVPPAVLADFNARLRR